MRALAVPVVMLVALAAPARADEEKVPLDKAPKAVLEAAKKRFPKAEVVGVSKETENGKTVYEVEMKQGGKTTDVTLTPEGAIVLIEREIDAKDLPRPVAGALEKKYPKAAYKIVEAVYAVKGGKESLDFYEVELTTADKKVFEVQLFPDGKVKATEEKKAGEKDEKKPVLYLDEEGKNRGAKKGKDEGEEKGRKAKKEDEGEDDVELPKAVAGAVREKFPGGKVVGASKEGKGQKALYEVELRYKAATLEVLLTLKGEVVEVEVKGKKDGNNEGGKKGKKKDDEGEGRKGQKKGEDDEDGKKAQGKKSGAQGEQKGQREDRDEKKGEGKKKGEKDRD